MVRKMFSDHGFVEIKHVPCVHFHPVYDSLVAYHGDDFVAEGEPEALDAIEGIISGTFRCKVLPRTGPGAEAEGLILRRTVVWSADKGFFIMPDQKTSRTSRTP